MDEQQQKPNIQMVELSKSNARKMLAAARAAYDKDLRGWLRFFSKGGNTPSMSYQDLKDRLKEADDLLAELRRHSVLMEECQYGVTHGPNVAKSLLDFSQGRTKLSASVASTIDIEAKLDSYLGVMKLESPEERHKRKEIDQLDHQEWLEKLQRERQAIPMVLNSWRAARHSSRPQDWIAEIHADLRGFHIDKPLIEKVLREYGIIDDNVTER